MIVRLSGKLVEQSENALVIDVNGLCYEVLVPGAVMQNINELIDAQGNVSLITYYYWQIGPSTATPTIIGFSNEVERDFFQEFIKVSGIGPRAAVRALNQPISEITRAIDENNVAFLKSLPGIGAQRAKEVVAKLQGKVAKFGLIKDANRLPKETQQELDFQDEALSVLLQLQYKKPEAMDMIEKALKRADNISTTEALLNEIYKQRIQA